MPLRIARKCGGFFFQAEDGIRDLTVTGVQTCALPICEHPEGIIGAQVGLGGERKLREVRELFQIAGMNARGLECLAVVRHILVRVLERPAQPLALQGAQLVGARLLDRLGSIHGAHHFMNPGSQVATEGKATTIASSPTTATLKRSTPPNTVPIGRWRSRLFTTTMFIPT